MVEVVDSEDEMVGRQRGEEEHDVVQLPSGARQKVVRGPLSGAESTVRRRKNPPPKYKDSGPLNVKASSLVSSKKSKSGTNKMVWAVNTVAGYLVMIWLSYQFSRYLYQLHENDMWFSEIMEVEREISFRTEQGLYYSYFKQLVLAQSLSEGFHQLRYNNQTEST